MYGVEYSTSTLLRSQLDYPHCYRLLASPSAPYIRVESVSHQTLQYIHTHIYRVLYIHYYTWEFSPVSKYSTWALYLHTHIHICIHIHRCTLHLGTAGLGLGLSSAQAQPCTLLNSGRYGILVYLSTLLYSTLLYSTYTVVPMHIYIQKYSTYKHTYASACTLCTQVQTHCRGLRVTTVHVSPLCRVEQSRVEQRQSILLVPVLHSPPVSVGHVGYSCPYISIVEQDRVEKSNYSRTLLYLTCIHT